jgi:hypothetical protein
MADSDNSISSFEEINDEPHGQTGYLPHHLDQLDHEMLEDAYWDGLDERDDDLLLQLSVPPPLEPLFPRGSKDRKGKNDDENAYDDDDDDDDRELEERGIPNQEKASHPISSSPQSPDSSSSQSKSKIFSYSNDGVDQRKQLSARAQLWHSDEGEEQGLLGDQSDALKEEEDEDADLIEREREIAEHIGNCFFPSLSSLHVEYYNLMVKEHILLLLFNLLSSFFSR